MAAFDDLIESLNANNFFFPVSICIVVGAVLILTVFKLLSKSDKRDKASSSFDVDDWDKEINSKKTKEKKGKAANTQAESGTNSTRSKITGKQTAAAKTATPPVKEKQAEKPKALAKKQATSPVSSKSVQPTNDQPVQGEWLVAGSKKKQKSNKKTGGNVEESKTKDQTDRPANDVEVVKAPKSVAKVAPKEVTKHPKADLVDSVEREGTRLENESVQSTVTVTSSQPEIVVSQPSRPTYDEPPVKKQNKEPLGVENAAEAGVYEDSVEPDPTAKETKSKKSSKKKKSKVVSEPAQVTDLTVQKTSVARSQQDESSQVKEIIPSSSSKEPEAAQCVETVRKSNSKPTKTGSKDVVAEEARIAVPDASKDVVKVAAKSVVKVASKDVIPDSSKGLSEAVSKGAVKDASKGVVKDASKGVVKDASKGMVKDVPKGAVNDASKGVVNDDSKGVVNDASNGVVNDASKGVVNDTSKKTVPDGAVDGPAASQLVAFDELGLKEISADVGQPLLKKKKKARKDI